jgi:tetratricopeptide (TPR) repeat protein
VDTDLKAGEAAYAKGDWQQAIAAYSRAWDLDHSSTAALYLGDTYFVMKDVDRAGEWFAKAIELEPNSETAYRYWGDALMARGKMREARAKYIEGLVADPYQAASTAGLRKWLTKNHLVLKKIPITLPQGPSVDKSGHTSINVDASTLKNPGVGAAWLLYSEIRVAWQKGQFSKKYPEELSYRHSLAEELAALESVVQLYREPPPGKPRIQDEAIELLSKLEDEGLLEPFVLLTHADAGIVQDYPSYRAAHRDKLNAFLDQYLVPPAPGTIDSPIVALDPPVLKVGDAWIYRATTERPSARNQIEEEVKVVRVTPTAIIVAAKLAGSTQPAKQVLLGADWSVMRDLNGKRTVVNRPFAFPLSEGKSWDVLYTEQAPNTAHKFERFNIHFRVVGYEAVEVPAGKFRALKIESEGRWEARLADGQSVGQGAQTAQGVSTATITHVQDAEERQTSGRLYKAFWYVPEAKRWVKSVEESYSSEGVRSERYSEELESFKPDENSAH